MGGGRRGWVDLDKRGVAADQRTVAALQVLARHGLKNEVWLTGMKLTALNSQNPRAYETEPFFLKRCWLIARIQLKLQLSCRAAQASLSAISAACFISRLRSDFRKKIGEENIPTESTGPGDHV